MAYLSLRHRLETYTPEQMLLSKKIRQNNQLIQRTVDRNIIHYHELMLKRAVLIDKLRQLGVEWKGR